MEGRVRTSRVRDHRRAGVSCSRGRAIRWLYPRRRHGTTTANDSWRASPAGLALTRGQPITGPDRAAGRVAPVGHARHSWRRVQNSYGRTIRSAASAVGRSGDGEYERCEQGGRRRGEQGPRAGPAGRGDDISTPDPIKGFNLIAEAHSLRPLAAPEEPRACGARRTRQSRGRGGWAPAGVLPRRRAPTASRITTQRSPRAARGPLIRNHRRGSSSWPPRAHFRRSADSLAALRTGQNTRGPAGCEEPAKGSVGRSQICFFGPRIRPGGTVSTGVRHGLQERAPGGHFHLRRRFPHPRGSMVAP